MFDMRNGTAYGRTWSIGELSKLAGVSVRTLHHYDDIGLLPPAGRTASGYRAYDEEDLLRLQRILAYRELGFSLEDVARILDDPAVDAQEHLLRQRELLTDRIEKLQRIVDAVDKTLEARKMGLKLDPQEMFEVFGDNDPTRYEEETRERWGDTDAYKQSQQRTSSYGKEEWLQIKAEGDASLAAFAAAFGAGLPPDSAEAMDAAEGARQHMSRWFYDVSTEMHRCLAEMYVADERFTAYYDRVATGLAAYVHDAVHANADRQDEGKAAHS
jgi:DNA-binding transcriptional MerR regulator